MSVRRQIRVMGAEKADDLISTMILDHEQADPSDRSDSRTAMGDTRPPTTSPADSDNPITSLVSRIWKSKTVAEDLVQPVYLAVKQTHWKPKEKALKCANPNCRKLFTPALNKRRNCAMCGEVFCQNCTNYSRRLSSNANPDPLGQFYSVCQACFNYHNEFGGARDHMREFHIIRQKRRDLIKNGEQSQESFPLCSRRSTECKKVVMRKEVGRLVEGFRENHAKYRVDVLEVKVPEWQKSSNWVVSRDALACLNCGNRFGMIKRKLHCRIGGHVFCSNCATEDLILYLDEDEQVRWALNGKEGGPINKPDRFRLLVICQSCSLELQEILLEKICAPRPSVFLQSLTNIHEKLSKEFTLIETNMPRYKQLVESMEASNCSPRQVEDKNPMHRLIKSQLDLSDAFSRLAVDSQKLNALRPKSHMQEKLLRNVKMGTFRSYSDNMFSFRNLKNHLSEFVPIETMGVIQESLSQRSMERVHVFLQQLIFEALNLEHKYGFNNSFFASIITISKHIDVEFKEFMEMRKESWEDHSKAVMKFIEEEMKNGRKVIKIDEALQRQTHVVYYLVVSQCASVIHECYRELQAKTIHREFKMVKESLREGCEKLDSTLIALNSYTS